MLERDVSSIAHSHRILGSLGGSGGPGLLRVTVMEPQ